MVQPTANLRHELPTAQRLHNVPLDDCTQAASWTMLLHLATARPLIGSAPVASCRRRHSDTYCLADFFNELLIGLF